MALTESNFEELSKSVGDFCLEFGDISVLFCHFSLGLQLLFLLSLLDANDVLKQPFISCLTSFVTIAVFYIPEHTFNEWMKTGTSAGSLSNSGLVLLHIFLNWINILTMDQLIQ